ncbi:MAG: LPS assembly protein LptD [Alphaproteobacteria bacterium]|nr:LPS assembly protein LptD [Alphaproteobacteria bacterium]
MKRAYITILSAIACGAANAASVDFDQPKTIIADKIEYDIKSESIQTSGKTEIINQSGQRMTLRDSYISKDGSALAGDDIKIWLGQHVYVDAENVTREGDLTIAKDATFTACDGCDSYGDAWTISATTVRHNMATRMLRFYNPVFWIYGVPAFWFPIFEMPDPGVKHKTGFLMPDFESTNKMGTMINIPFYVYLSEYQDMTVTLAYLTQENPLFKAEHRLNAEHSQYRTRGSFTRNKDGENRWHIFNNDVIQLGEYARATIFLERTSDKTYLQKYGFYNSQPYLDSGARLELFGQSGYVVSDAHVFQELRSSGGGRYSTPSGDILPNIRGVWQTAPIYEETYMTFGADVLGISGSGTASQRVIGDARITSPWTLWGGNRITASLAARYDVYNFDHADMVTGENFTGLKNRFLPSGYVEWGLPLYRPDTTWSQVIEPRARLTAMAHTSREQFALNNDSAGAFLSDATLFADKRFAGLDLWENGTFADYGVRWAAFNNISGNTFEVFLGQTYDFKDRADTDPNSGFHNGASDYVGRIGYNNMKWFDMSSRFRVDRANFSLRHMETTGRIGTSANYISLGHIWSQRFIDAQTMGDDINEATVGAGIKLSQRWAVQWNGIYNMTERAFHSHTGGIFYNHPCYYMSLQYRRDNSIKDDYVGTTTYQFRIGMSVDGQQY